MASENPITEICIVSDKGRCPPGFSAITKAYDDSSYDADLWKDSIFSFSRIYRYICFSQTVPSNCRTCNVIADIALVNDKDNIPTGFTPVEYTVDTKEKALRKKILCVRSVPREFAVDAVCEFIVIAKQKKPPTSYSLAGDLDGLLLCFRYGVIPTGFPNNPQSESKSSSAYPSLPYPIHPLSHSSNVTPNRPAPSIDRQKSFGSSPATPTAYNRQSSLASSLHSTGIEGLPFELNPRIKRSRNKANLPEIKPFSPENYDYDFSIESTVLVDS